MIPRFSAILALSMILFLSLPVAASTVQVEGVRFSTVVDVQKERLTLQGTAVLKVMVFIDAYAGALYLPASTPRDNVLGPVPKRLELSYFHAISSDDFANATRAKILDNVTAAEAERLASRIDRLAAMYRDVRPGDRYALTYVPGDGTRLSLNGDVLGSIPGDDFARAVFSIWLGADPIDETFKNQLLGAS